MVSFPPKQPYRCDKTGGAYTNITHAEQTFSITLCSFKNEAKCTPFFDEAFRSRKHNEVLTSCPIVQKHETYRNEKNYRRPSLFLGNDNYEISNNTKTKRRHNAHKPLPGTPIGKLKMQSGLRALPRRRIHSAVFLLTCYCCLALQ